MQLPIDGRRDLDMEMPFGGAKRSGVGREPGPSALEHYSEQHSVFIAEE